jgi:hypothetical protein
MLASKPNRFAKFPSIETRFGMAKMSLAYNSKTWRKFFPLGLAGYFRVWIPNYSLLAAPLYDATKGDPSLLISIDTPFRRLQQALLQAPALHLPDTQKTFTLYVHENKGLALGVLGQDKGPTFAPVAYLSKKLDPTVRGWVPCLRALSAAYVLVQE